MGTCQYETVVSAYHDSELGEGARASFEQHLSACPPCQNELQQLRRMSAFMKAAPSKHLSAQAKQDLYALAPAVGEGVYLRIAEWTTALAASVLIAASLWLFHTHPVQQNPETAVLTPVILNPPQAHDAAEVSDDPQLVDWISANVAAGQNQ
jgi:anti-sigma factor RsiW